MHVDLHAVVPSSGTDILRIFFLIEEEAVLTLVFLSQKKNLSFSSEETRRRDSSRSPSKMHLNLAALSEQDYLSRLSTPNNKPRPFNPNRQSRRATGGLPTSCLSQR